MLASLFSLFSLFSVTGEFHRFLHRGRAKLFCEITKMTAVSTYKIIILNERFHRFVAWVSGFSFSRGRRRTKKIPPYPYPHAQKGLILRLTVLLLQHIFTIRHKICRQYHFVKYTHRQSEKVVSCHFSWFVRFIMSWRECNFLKTDLHAKRILTSPPCSGLVAVPYIDTL